MKLFKGTLAIFSILIKKVIETLKSPVVSLSFTWSNFGLYIVYHFPYTDNDKEQLIWSG